MIINVVIPTRGDRPELLEQCYRQIERQTRTPDHVITSQAEIGVTGNVRAGYEKATKGIVVIMEDDDMYAPNYLERIESEWDDNFDILGWDQSIYYHIKLLQYRIIRTTKHCSLMTTALKANLDIEWPENDHNFLDIELWKQLNGKTIKGFGAIGIKHGIGKCGGKGHLWNFYTNSGIDDYDMKFLDTFVQDDFYRKLHKKL